VSQVRRFIVEYDLPTDSRRRRFYRALHKYREERGLEDKSWSTQSVVNTVDVKFAWEVHRQALKVGGTSHIYEARQLDREPLHLDSGTGVTVDNLLGSTEDHKNE